MGSVARSIFGGLPVALLLGLLVACGETQGNAPGAGGSSTASGGSSGASVNEAGSATGGAAAQAGSASAGSSNLGGETSSAGTGGASGSGGQAPNEPLFPALLDDCDAKAANERADLALASMLVGFWSGADQYLYAASPTTGTLTGYWTYAQAFDALLDGVERTGGQRYRGLVRNFYDGRELQGWLVDYFDDETWMTLALLRAYDLTGEQLYLDQAKTVYEDIMAAWDTSCCGEHLGGIWWNRQHQQKATASNAGPVIAGARLSKLSGDPKYLAFAKQAYDFWLTHMVNPQNYAIYDHLSPSGTRALGSLSYNHGVMIGAALELHAATGEAHFLDEAHKFGHYLVTVATRPSSAGPLLYDSLGGNCDGDCPAWKGIAYRYLAELFRQDTTKQEYRDVLVAGPAGIWTLARNADTNFFSANWAGPPPQAGGIEEQAAAVMALNLHAMLCGSPAPSAGAPGRYEAEEAQAHRLALEAKYAGFSGFGYVSAFMAKLQSVSFDITEPAGSYRVDWRYAAGAGSAVRSVFVDGKLVTPSQAFQATTGWDQWAVSSTIVELPGGKASVELRYDSSSSAGLNLDRIDLALQ